MLKGQGDIEYRRFSSSTGIALEPGCSVDTAFHDPHWHQSAPRTEIVTTEFGDTALARRRRGPRRRRRRRRRCAPPGAVRGLFGDEQRDLFGLAAQQAAAFSQPGDQGGAGTRLQRHGPRAAAGVGDRQCPGPFG
ncbi:hypothetical protein [Nocardia gipuzkoensis]